jgi:ABC-type multidrug transport system ATPase subunit
MILELNNVTKSYSKNNLALDNFSLKIQRGVLGILGPNGAGKSTLIKLLSTMEKPLSGNIIYNGINIVKKPDYIRKDLGYLPQDFGTFNSLNAYEFLEYVAALKGLAGKGVEGKIDHMLRELNLSNVAKYQIGTYSGGMKQRLGIAQALINNPKVLILDEPTVGLDPEERIRFKELISDLGMDRIVIISSHIVSDIESVANQIVIMQNGSVLKQGNQLELLESMKGMVFELFIAHDRFLDFKTKNLVVSSVREQNGYRVRFIEKISSNEGIKVNATLEDLYIYLTKNRLL